VRLLALALLVSACAPPQYVTTCGVALVGESVDAADYQRSEDELSARLPGACASWSGTTAVAMPGRESLHNGRHVEGWTDCPTATVYFHAGYSRFWRTAFTHELVHIAQRCDSPLPIDEHRDVDHSDWTRHGYARALLDVQEVFMLEDAKR